MTRELQRAIQALAVECDDTYAMANSIEDMLEEIFDDHEEQLKAKDEEIEREHNLNLVLLNAFANEEIKKKSKARSIVAMLFWEWRKYNSNFKNEENGFIQGRASKTKELFYKSYKMLKEQQ